MGGGRVGLELVEVRGAGDVGVGGQGESDQCGNMGREKPAL